MPVSACFPDCVPDCHHVSRASGTVPTCSSSACLLVCLPANPRVFLSRCQPVANVPACRPVCLLSCYRDFLQASCLPLSLPARPHAFVTTCLSACCLNACLQPCLHKVRVPASNPVCQQTKCLPDTLSACIVSACRSSLLRP